MDKTKKPANESKIVGLSQNILESIGAL